MYYYYLEVIPLGCFFCFTNCSSYTILRFGMQDAIRHIENHILSAAMDMNTIYERGGGSSKYVIKSGDSCLKVPVPLPSL